MRESIDPGLVARTPSRLSLQFHDCATGHGRRIETRNGHHTVEICRLGDARYDSFNRETGHYVTDQMNATREPCAATTHVTRMGPGRNPRLRILSVG